MLYQAEACNDLVGPISALLRPGNTTPLEENVAPMASRWPMASKKKCRTDGKPRVRFFQTEIGILDLHSSDERVTTRLTGRQIIVDCYTVYFMKSS